MKLLAVTALLGLTFALGGCAAGAATAEDAETLVVTVTRPQCPLAEGDGKTFFLRGPGVPAELSSGEKLELVGHRVMTRFLPKDPACRDFDLVFEAQSGRRLSSE